MARITDEKIQQMKRDARDLAKQMSAARKKTATPSATAKKTKQKPIMVVKKGGVVKPMSKIKQAVHNHPKHNKKECGVCR